VVLNSCTAPTYKAVIRHKQIENNNGYSFTLSPYSGNPSLENDEAWGDLLKGELKLSRSSDSTQHSLSRLHDGLVYVSRQATISESLMKP
jgi:hypothetical protein